MKQAEKIRWGTERRLEFIEFRIYWEGGIRRADLTETAGRLPESNPFPLTWLA